MSIAELEKENTLAMAKAAAEKLLGTEAPEVPPVAPVVAKEETPVVPPVVEAPKAKPTTDEAKLETAIDALEDDESPLKPDEKGALTMPFKAFERRIERAGKAHLKAIFGTDNREEILKMKKDYEKVLAEREEERRSKLAAEEVLKEDLAKERKRANELESKWNAQQEEQAAAVEEERIGVIASKYLDADSFDLAHYKFAKHLKKLTAEKLDAYTDTDVENWYKNFAEKHPKHARPADAPPPAVKKVGLNVGASGDKKPSVKTVDPNAKTPVPGKANSMTNAEWNTYKRQHGITY